jgi:hypothetical protein
MDINTAKKIFKSFYCHFVADIAKICIKFCKETFFPSKFIAYTGFPPAPDDRFPISHNLNF